MRDDAVIANAGRLKILAALSTESRLEFVRLRDRAKLTDGNLASHAKRLQSAGLVEIQKRFDSGKPVTTYTITPRGRDALQEHVDRLMGAISRVADEPEMAAATHDDDWVD
jgi:DNA-binding MarR family transcriptional regulator